MPSVSKNDVKQLPAGSNIYIYNLHPSIESRDIYEMFSQHGVIVSCKIVRNKVTGQSLCRGYVQYDSKKSADEAISNEDGKYFGGSCIRVSSFVSKEERVSSFTSKKTPTGVLNVSGIHPEVSETELKAMFELFGTVHSVYFTLSPAGDDNEKAGSTEQKDGYHGNFKTGWGYVNYYDSFSAKIAKSALNDVFFYGSKLIVCERDNVRANAQEGPGEEVTQFPVVIRTFDWKITLAKQIEPVLKELFPDLGIPSSSVKVYDHIEGTALQCVSIMTSDAEQARMIVEKVNSPENRWETLVGCLAGKDAIKYRRRNMEERANKRGEAFEGNENRKDFENKAGSITSPTAPSSYRSGGGYNGSQYSQHGYKSRGQQYQQHQSHQQQQSDGTRGFQKGYHKKDHKFFKSRSNWNGREYEEDKKQESIGEERENEKKQDFVSATETAAATRIVETERKSSSLESIKKENGGSVPRVVPTPSRSTPVQPTATAQQQQQGTGVPSYYMGWPMDSALYHHQYSLYNPYQYAMYNQAQFAGMPDSGAAGRFGGMEIPLATPEQMKTAAGYGKGNNNHNGNGGGYGHGGEGGYRRRSESEEGGRRVGFNRDGQRGVFNREDSRQFNREGHREFSREGHREFGREDRQGYNYKYGRHGESFGNIGSNVDVGDNSGNNGNSGRRMKRHETSGYKASFTPIKM